MWTQRIGDMKKMWCKSPQSGMGVSLRCCGYRAEDKHDVAKYMNFIIGLSSNVL